MKASENLPEPIAFLKAIHEAQIRYLLIGRQAVIAYGGPVQTMDYDIYIDGSQENTDRFLDIALGFGLTPSLPKSELNKTFKYKLENDFTVDVFRAKQLSSPKTGKILFEDIYKRKVVANDKTGLKINLPCLDDLILLKKLRSSPKDLLDIEYLEKIKENK